MTSVLIVGLGLIGGSLALNLSTYSNDQVSGYDLDDETKIYAVKKGIVHKVYDDFTEAVLDNELIIFACPVSATCKLIEQLSHMQFSDKKIFTDVGSVKQPILKSAALLTQQNIAFVGGHPMAGSHKRGITAAKAHLFENAVYVLIKTGQATDADVDFIKTVLNSTKANFITLDGLEHDEMTSVISHFPHLIASSLVHQAEKWQNKHPKIRRLAAGGFRDITRIASSDPDMWQDILFQNKKIVRQLLSEWIIEMTTLEEMLATEKTNELHQYLQKAKCYRDGLDRTKRGALPAFFDIYVDIFDQPGALLSVVSLLFEAEISIKNIEILEIREGITGVLRLSFVSLADQRRSYTCLTEQGYEVTVAD